LNISGFHFSAFRGKQGLTLKGQDEVQTVPQHNCDYSSHIKWPKARATDILQLSGVGGFSVQIGSEVNRAKLVMN
jgi:hypothetical protein